MNFDHTAFIVKDIKKSAKWYQENFDAKIIDQYDDWAFLEIYNTKLALSTGKHPYHIGIRCDKEEDLERLGGKVYNHRDGTKSIYKVDLDDNAVEFIFYPKTHKK